jgi:hypothetical protein
VALFRKSADPAPSTEVVPYQPPVKPSAALPAGALEREIRREIWSHMSPELAHAAQLSLAELFDWTSGATRLSPPQIEALARKMGLIEDTPPTGVDLVRSKLRVMMKKWPSFVTHFEWRHGDQALRDFLDGGSLTHGQVEFLARAFYGEGVSIDPQTAELRRPVREAAPVSTLKFENWSKGSNVPGINEMVTQNLRERLRQLEASA